MCYGILHPFPIVSVHVTYIYHVMPVLTSTDVRLGLELIGASPMPGHIEEGHSYSRGLSLPSLNIPAERRRIQNRIAQRKYRVKLKERLEHLEQRVILDVQRASNILIDTKEDSVDPAVLAYQAFDDAITIQCICGNTNDHRFIITCMKCGTWQHITCYYDLAQNLVEDHEYFSCLPRDLTGHSKRLLKRTTDHGWAQNTATSGTRSGKRVKTVGAESSVDIKLESDIYSEEETSSIYSTPEKKSTQGPAYPMSLAPSLALKWDKDQSLPRDALNSEVVLLQKAYIDHNNSNFSLACASGAEFVYPVDNRACSEPHWAAGSNLIFSLEHAGDHYGSQCTDSDSAGQYHWKTKIEPSRPSKTIPADGPSPTRANTKLIKTEQTFEEAQKLKKELLECEELVEIKTLKLEQLNETLAIELAPKLKEPSFPRKITDHDESLHSNKRPRHEAASVSKAMLSTTIEAENTVRSSKSERFQMCRQKDLHKERSDSGEARLADESLEAHVLSEADHLLMSDWTLVQNLLPDSWKWDVEFQSGCWNCTPLEPKTPKHYPLTIAGLPLVLPVEHQWPPIGGANPPPDPRSSALLNGRAPLSLEVIRDLFLTFEASVGFYILISGMLQVIVPADFDVAWASSHLPHKYGGLRVCYILQTLESTMLPSTTETTKTNPTLNSQSSSLASLFRQSRLSTSSASQALRLNDFIDARPSASHRKEKYSGRIGLKVSKMGEPYLIMSTHILTEAILTKSHRAAFFPRSRGRFDKLDDDWNEHVEVWAGNEKIGTVNKSFDEEPENYPNGFRHDISLVKPATPASVKDIASPINDLGWLNRDSWNSLRQYTAAVKILGPTEAHRTGKSVKCSRPSEVMVVGEGIFLNQTGTAGSSKSLKDHDISTWRSLVSRTLLYRVYPDFDPPNGYSGVALYAEGAREDGTAGPGIVGFQSFVQRSGHVQSFNMEGPALDKRLQLGRVAFYGAFEVPDELKREYTIV